MEEQFLSEPKIPLMFVCILETNLHHLEETLLPKAQKHFWQQSKNYKSLWLSVKKYMFSLNVAKDMSKQFAQKCARISSRNLRKVLFELWNTFWKETFNQKNNLQSKVSSAQVTCSFHQPAETFRPQFGKFPLKERS